MSAEISIQVQNTLDFESCKEKNNFIKTAESEWIGFVDGNVTGEEELRQILQENPFLLEYDVILFGSNVPEGECGCMELFEHPQCVIYAFFFRKSLLAYAGSYNRFLTGNNNYEFLLRLAEIGSVYSIPSSADKCTEFAPMTMAYILRRYMELLKAQGRLDDIFLQIVRLAEQTGKTKDFNKAMNSLLADEREYEQIVRDTAPCLLMVSSDLEYYGVVDGFANALADELVSLGQAVITTNGRYGDYYNIPKGRLLNQVYKAIIGFQSPALQSETFRNMKGPRYQFWLDDPIFSIDFLKRTPKQTHFLCQDANYASFLKKHFAIEKAEQFPPGGMDIDIKKQDKIYGVVFIGSYFSTKQEKRNDPFEVEFIKYMQSHVEATVEQGICTIWNKHGIQYEEQDFLHTIEGLVDVCHELLHDYRHRVIEAILDADITLHVFGDSWKSYNGKGCQNLVIHPKVMTEEALQVWSQAKIGLNIMDGHKAGMTERVSNIMLAGTCCLSDETSCLKENFCDGEDIVLFRGDRMDELVEKIRYLLNNDDERERIALAGREKALQKHTWRKRAEELLEIIDGGAEFNEAI